MMLQSRCYVIVTEVAIPLAAMSKNLIYPAANLPDQKVKRAFQCQRRLGLAGCLFDVKMTCTIAFQSTYHGCRVNGPLFTRLPGEQVLIYQAAG